MENTYVLRSKRYSANLVGVFTDTVVLHDAIASLDVEFKVEEIGVNSMTGATNTFTKQEQVPGYTEWQEQNEGKRRDEAVAKLRDLMTTGSLADLERAIVAISDGKVEPLLTNVEQSESEEVSVDESLHQEVEDVQDIAVIDALHPEAFGFPPVKSEELPEAVQEEIQEDIEEELEVLTFGEAVAQLIGEYAVDPGLEVDSYIQLIEEYGIDIDYETIPQPESQNEDEGSLFPETSKGNESEDDLDDLFGTSTVQTEPIKTTQQSLFENEEELDFTEDESQPVKEEPDSLTLDLEFDLDESSNENEDEDDFDFKFY